MPEATVYTYLVDLNLLDDQWAEFVCVDSFDASAPAMATLTVSREHWEKSERPTRVQVTLKQYVDPWEAGRDKNAGAAPKSGIASRTAGGTMPPPGAPKSYAPLPVSDPF